MNPMEYGFRVVGPATKERCVTKWHTAFHAYAECDDRAQCDKESYLSAFTFGSDFADHLRHRRTVKGLPESTPCFSPWLWWDIDRKGNVPKAQADAATLVVTLNREFAIDPDELLIFFSGSKGFHVGLSTDLFRCEPSAHFHHIAQQFCQTLAEKAGITIDLGIYDRVRIFRAPNSRHPATGLHKIQVGHDELMHVATDAILDRAKTPAIFEIPSASKCDWNLQNAWDQAIKHVMNQSKAMAEYRATHKSAKLNRLTFEFIRGGAAPGGSGDDVTTGEGRHRRLFSAAANLAEFGCPSELTHALLTEAGLDCGLTPADVRRQIDCGLKHMMKGVQ